MQKQRFFHGRSNPPALPHAQTLHNAGLGAWLANWLHVQTADEAVKAEAVNEAVNEAALQRVLPPV